MVVCERKRLWGLSKPTMSSLFLHQSLTVTSLIFCTHACMHCIALQNNPPPSSHKINSHLVSSRFAALHPSAIPRFSPRMDISHTRYIHTYTTVVPPSSDAPCWVLPWHRTAQHFFLSLRGIHSAPTTIIIHRGPRNPNSTKQTGERTPPPCVRVFSLLLLRLLLTGNPTRSTYIHVPHPKFLLLLLYSYCRRARLSIIVIKSVSSQVPQHTSFTSWVTPRNVFA